MLFQSFYNGAKPIVIITKCDLLTSSEIESLQQQLEFLREIDVATHFLYFDDSKHELEELKKIISIGVTTTAGPSGVGKSTLINRLQNIKETVTGEVSSRLKRGKHTTTLSTLIALNSSSYLCDTPGFLSLELPPISDIFELLSGMPFLEKYFGKCKFNNCSHTNEPHFYFKEKVSENISLQPLYDFYISIYHTLFQKRR